MTRRVLPLTFAAIAVCAGGWAHARQGGELATIAAAQREAAEATRRSEKLEQDAAKATGEAARARQAAAALAARIQAAEADISAAEGRIALTQSLRRAQRARLAERQGPLVRLIGALQTMARRPPALALVQPGSMEDAVHVRAVLASTLPAVRAKTAALRVEVERGNRLARQAADARVQLLQGQEELRRRRTALARLELDHRRRSDTLLESALSESDRALAFGEEARELAALAGTRAFQDRLRRDLATLPGPALRPGAAAAAAPAGPAYRLPVEGRLVAGLGELSDAGVHARGLTFATTGGAEAVAPAPGRIAFAGPLEGHGLIVIVDHGKGWTSAITGLAELAVEKGATVAVGDPLGRAQSGRDPQVTVELRRNGAPFPITALLGRD